jgi:hypothetical protein
MQVIFSELAKTELIEAVNHYDLQFSGLGKRFKSEVEKAILRIIDYPLAWSIELGDIRKCLLHKFPFKILYSIEPNHIFIIAIAHQHRRPNYWINAVN